MLAVSRLLVMFRLCPFLVQNYRRMVKRRTSMGTAKKKLVPPLKKSSGLGIVRDGAGQGMAMKLEAI